MLVLHLQATPSAAQKRGRIGRVLGKPLRHFLVAEAANAEVQASCRRATRRGRTAPSASVHELLLRSRQECRTARRCHRAAPAPPFKSTLCGASHDFSPTTPRVAVCCVAAAAAAPPPPPLPHTPPDLSGQSCGVHTTESVVLVLVLTHS